MSESINQLADLIMGIIQEKVDERIDPRYNGGGVRH